ncbi:MAG: hypothetical protein GXO90_00670 [FCB group bacterium]|nr:hypothetical protein [FCB group bacterium]
MKRFWIALILVQCVWAQPETPSLTPIVAYWKTLKPDQKEVFLFSYLTQVYDTYTSLKSEYGYNEITTWYYDEKAELVFAIFDQLNTAELSEFVQWIDEFYSHDMNVGQSFDEALKFAYRFQQAEGNTIWEKYQHLDFDKIEVGEDSD